MKVSWSISPILALKLVAMATSLERFEKKMVKSVIYDQIPIGENFIKIGQVDLEIICLKILKERNEGCLF